MKKANFANYQIKKPASKRKVMAWQDYAAKACEELQVGKKYQGQMFQMARDQMPFFKAKVENMREMKNFNPRLWADLERKEMLGHYFLKTFSKNK